MRILRQGCLSHTSWFWVLGSHVFAKLYNNLEVAKYLRKLPTNWKSYQQIMKKLLAYCEEVTSVWSKVTSHKTKGWGHLGKVALVIYHDFGHLGDMYLQNSRIIWMLPNIWESYRQIEKVTCKSWRSYQHMEKLINYIIKGWGYLDKVTLVMYHDFGCLGDMYLKNSRIIWKLPSIWKSY